MAFMTVTLDVGPFAKILRRVPGASDQAIRIAVARVGAIAFNRTRIRTPSASGRARAGWQMRSIDGGKVVEIFNRVPYAGVLEFGGYPVRAARRARSGGIPAGRALLGGLPPGIKTMRPIGGDFDEKAKPGGAAFNSNVTRQAPQGMMRVSLKEVDERDFAPALEDALQSALRGLE